MERMSLMSKVWSAKRINNMEIIIKLYNGLERDINGRGDLTQP